LPLRPGGFDERTLKAGEDQPVVVRST